MPALARYDVVLSIGDCSFKELVNEYVCFNTRSGPGMIRIFFAFHEERQKVSSLFEGGNAANREQNINLRIGREWKVNLQKKIPKILLILSKKLKRVNMAPCRGLPHTTSSAGGR